MFKKSEETFELTQFHYVAWPDHGVPEYATGVLSFYRRVRGFHSDSKDPILVHCRLEISMFQLTNECMKNFIFFTIIIYGMIQ